VKGIHAEKGTDHQQRRRVGELEVYRTSKGEQCEGSVKRCGNIIGVVGSNQDGDKRQHNRHNDNYANNLSHIGCL